MHQETWETQLARDYLEARGWVWAGTDGRRSKYRHEKLTRSETGAIWEVNLRKALDIQKQADSANAEPTEAAGPAGGNA